VRDTAGLVLTAWALEELGGGFAPLGAGADAAGGPVDAAGRRAAFDAPLPPSLAEALAAAERRAADAEAEADALRAEAEAAVDDAYARGYEEGRVAGELGEGARLRHAAAAAERALDELRAGEERWAGTLEENVCALATAIARQLLERELAGDPGVVLALVRKALKEFPVDQPLVVRVNAGDLAALASVVDAEGAGRMGGHDLRWVADTRVAPGGCLVEGRERIVDGRVDTGLERVYRRLTYTNA
jgi:flagellar biosynthesis/type III secretory pathway protein FliH